MSKQQGFSMVGGTGETSYANNSIPQKTVIRKIRPLLEESVRAVCSSTSPKLLHITDLGCSSGPNTLAVLQSIIDVVISSTSQGSGLQIPEVNMFLNDLPDNDFNTIFKSLPSFIKTIEENNEVEIPCFVSGMPGSFYGRLFPRSFMHLMHSSNCLHWISQVPKGLMGDNEKKILNKGCIYATKSSHPDILKGYREQFTKDVTMFLRCRSDEMVHGGHIVLSFVVTLDDEPCPLMELASKALYKLVSEGQIDKEKLDEFNLPYYRPTIEQVKQLIEVEGRLALHKLETFPVSWVASITAENRTTHQDRPVHPSMVAESISRAIRSLVETLLVNAFGEEIVDDVFRLVQGMITNNIAAGEEMEVLILAVSLVKRDLRH